MAEDLRLLAQELQLDASAQPVEILLNPLKTQVGLVGAAVETARSGPPRYDMHVQLRQRGGERQRVYGLSGFRHQDPAHDTRDPGSCHYNIRLQSDDGPVAAGGETFCGKLLCSADGTRYTFCDDPSNFYSWPRELGAVVVSGENLCVLLPRVHPSGASAQFRVLREDDGIIARFFAGHAREHLMLLSGPWATKRSGGEVQLVHLNGPSEGEVVFRAKELNGALAVQFRHPLSAYQAFGIALSLVHHAQVQAQQMQMQAQAQEAQAEAEAQAQPPPAEAPAPAPATRLSAGGYAQASVGMHRV